MGDSSKCALCGVVFLNDPRAIIQCVGSCGKYFHIKCTSLATAEARVLRSTKHAWTCDDCGPRCTKEVKIDDQLSKHMTELNRKVDILLTNINSQKDELANVVKQLEEYKESVNFCSNKIDDFIKELNKNRDEITGLQRHQDILEKENSEMKIRITNLENSLQELQQYSRNCNIEISNFPETQHENIEDIVKSVADVIGVEVEKDDIQAAHRVPTGKRGHPRPIVVQLKSRSLRGIWLRRAKQANKEVRLTAKRVNPSLVDSNIYLNEHLTAYYKRLFMETKRFAREAGYKFVWVSDSKIFLRQSESASVKRIKHFSDVPQLSTN